MTDPSVFDSVSLYPKIQSIFKRTSNGIIIPGEFSTPDLERLWKCGYPFYCREKVDGTNIRICYHPANPVQFMILGRTERSEIPAFLLKAIEELGLREKLPRLFPEGVTLFGEGYGPKIQKAGKLYRDDHSFVLFDVKVGPWWLEQEATELVADELKIDAVPIVYTGADLEQATAQIKREQGIRSYWGEVTAGPFPPGYVDPERGFRAEGLVCVPLGGLLGRDGKRIITKIKSVDFDKLRA
jgi:hypothetical protein